MSAMMNTHISHLGKKLGVPTGKPVVRQTHAQVVEFELKTGEKMTKFGLNVAVEWPKKEKGFGLFDHHALAFEWEAKNEDDDVAESNFNFVINWKVLVFLGLMGFVNKDVSFWIIKAIGVYFALQIAAVAYLNLKKN
ncbi:hypothetical protein CASFOL_025669 [Castilleja foliolosa]|uniref:Uncharacterized protein n=1 Tax=Castilleja foliolosa TaxID=1961234 RepID=A0ABD3CRS0_9LAMI